MLKGNIEIKFRLEVDFSTRLVEMFLDRFFFFLLNVNKSLKMMSEVDFSRSLDNLCARTLQEERESTIYHILSEKFTFISITWQSPKYDS